MPNFCAWLERVAIANAAATASEKSIGINFGFIEAWFGLVVVQTDTGLSR
jgi:hypothetical protein